jgi:hypothetical protein
MSDLFPRLMLNLSGIMKKIHFPFASFRFSRGQVKQIKFRKVYLLEFLRQIYARPKTERQSKTIDLFVSGENSYYQFFL